MSANCRIATQTRLQQLEDMERSNADLEDQLRQLQLNRRQRSLRGELEVERLLQELEESEWQAKLEQLRNACQKARSRRASETPAEIRRSRRLCALGSQDRGASRDAPAESALPSRAPRKHEESLSSDQSASLLCVEAATASAVAVASPAMSGATLIDWGSSRDSCRGQTAAKNQAINFQKLDGSLKSFKCIQDLQELDSSCRSLTRAEPPQLTSQAAAQAILPVSSSWSAGGATDVGRALEGSSAVSTLVRPTPTAGDVPRDARELPQTACLQAEVSSSSGSSTSGGASDLGPTASENSVSALTMASPAMSGASSVTTVVGPTATAAVTPRNAVAAVPTRQRQSAGVGGVVSEPPHARAHFVPLGAVAPGATAGLAGATGHHAGGLASRPASSDPTQVRTSLPVPSAASSMPCPSDCVQTLATPRGGAPQAAEVSYGTMAMVSSSQVALRHGAGKRVNARAV